MLTRLEQLEQSLNDKNIEVAEQPMTFDAISIKQNQSLIVLDNSRIHTQAELYVNLKHEEAHLDFPRTLYDFDTSLSQRKNKETRTNRRVIKDLLPREVLAYYFDKLEYTPEMIAEELNLPLSFIMEAIDYYRSC